MMGSSCRHFRDSTAFGMRLYVMGCWFSAIAFFSVDICVTVNVSPRTASRLKSRSFRSFTLMVVGRGSKICVRDEQRFTLQSLNCILR